VFLRAFGGGECALLDSFQQEGQRHSKCSTPFESVQRVSRQPYFALMSV
jgi:hypothetical protein